MFKEIRFTADALDFLASLSDVSQATRDLKDYLQEFSVELCSDSTEDVELSESLFEQLIIAQDEWNDSSGLINEMVAEFSCY